MKRTHMTAAVAGILLASFGAAHAASSIFDITGADAPAQAPARPAPPTPPAPPAPPTAKAAPASPAAPAAHAAPTDHHGASMSADAALEKLKAGNAAFISSDNNPGDISFERRFELAGGQHPYAVVVACSDSRVVPEAIFSAGLGELFVVRVAGNVIGDHELGSIEYALEHLGTELVVVLGHESCGAVGAAVDGGAERYTKTITDTIKSAIGDERDKKQASIANAQTVASQAAAKLNIGANGKVKVVPAFYHLSGKVEFL